jgi:mannose-6-phosphate isomerase-like protein (cupin superfamily)
MGDHMSFRPFFNPATGEWIEYTAVAEDSNGGLVRFKWRSVPGGVIAEHIHPHQEERFTITTGEARFTLNGEEHTSPERATPSSYPPVSLTLRETPERPQPR